MTFSFYHSLISQPARSRRSGAADAAHEVGAVLAARRAVVDDRAGLERDDELRWRLVLPDRVRSDHGQQALVRVAGHRQLRRGRERALGTRTRVVGDRGDDRHGARRELRVLAAAGRVVGEVPERAERGRRTAPQHHARHAAAIASARLLAPSAATDRRRCWIASTRPFGVADRPLVANVARRRAGDALFGDLRGACRRARIDLGAALHR